MSFRLPLAGRKAYVGCGDPTVKDDGRLKGAFSSDGPDMQGRAGYWWTEQRLPRKRGRVKIEVPRGDACLIATKETRADDMCLPVAAGDDMCLRVLVARGEKGRAALDERVSTRRTSVRWAGSSGSAR